MKASAIITSGTMSYGPPVWPPRPLASATAVKKISASRHSWMFLASLARTSGVSVACEGSSASGS
jgi:hypothetical protein